MRPVTELDPTGPTDDICPHCGATTGVQPTPAPPTVQAWTCTACGMDWAVTVVNPTVRAALSVVTTLPTLGRSAHGVPGEPYLGRRISPTRLGVMVRFGGGSGCRSPVPKLLSARERRGGPWPRQSDCAVDTIVGPNMLHVHSGYSTSAQGELLVAAFTADAKKDNTDMMESHVIPTI